MRKGMRSVTQPQKGALLVFVASVLYSLGGLCMKVIPWSGLAINGGRTAIALAVMLLYFWKSGHRLRFNRWILLGAAAVCSTNLLFSVANKITTAANAIVLQYTAPIFVILLSALCLNKKPGRLDVAACVVVFGGVVCFFVDSLSAGGLSGDVMALISGVTYAVVFMLNDLPGGDPLSSTFFGHIISAVIGLPFLFRETDFSTGSVTALLVLGVFQTGLAFIFLGEGLKITPSVTASLVSGLEPVLNPVLVAVFYHEFIGMTALVGAFIVVGGVIGYNILLSRQSAQIKE